MPERYANRSICFCPHDSRITNLFGMDRTEMQLPACVRILDKIDSIQHQHSYAVAAIIGKVPIFRSRLLWFLNLILPMSQSIGAYIVFSENSAKSILENIYDTGFIKNPTADE